MSIESVDLERALESATYAQQMLRSGKVSTEQKGQLVAKWGAENVNKWLSVDTTEYQIDDADYDASKLAGKEAAKESTGYDGKGGSTASAVGSAIGAGASAVGALAPSVLGGGIECAGNFLTTGSCSLSGAGSTLSETAKGAKNLGAYATVILAAAVAAKYWISNHNKDEHEAANHLKENELPEAQGSLNEAQGLMEDASEEVAELTEEAEAVNEDANDKIEENKTLFDFYKQQYDALKAKKESGEVLTPDEQALMKQLAPLMEGLNEDITTTSEDTSDQVNDLNDEIGEYQEVYDESAETIAEVEGVTDFAEGFDEKSRTLMYVEGASQGVNAASATRAAIMLSSGGPWNWAFAAIGYAAAASSGIATGQQFSWAGDMSKEIDLRRETQDLGTTTNDMYDEELENYATNIEVVEDLELEIPEDLEVPSDDAGAGASMMTMAADAGQTEEQGQTTPMGTQVNEDKSQSQTRGNDNTKGAGEENKNGDDKKKIEE